MIKAPGEAIIPGVRNSPTTLVMGVFLKLIHCGKSLLLFVAVLMEAVTDRCLPPAPLPLLVVSRLFLQNVCFLQESCHRNTGSSGCLPQDRASPAGTAQKVVQRLV